MNEQEWLEEGMRELCNREFVDFEHLLDIVTINSNGRGSLERLAILTQGEWKVLKAALEIAGGV